MKKNIWCFVLSMTLVISMLSLPVFANTENGSSGYLVREDFEGENSVFENVLVTDGAASLENSPTNSAVRALVSVDVPSKFVFEFDLQCNNDAAEIYLLLKDSDHAAEPYSSIMIIPKSFEANKNYTYRFLIDQSKLVRSNNTENFAAIEYYRAEAGTDEWVQGVYDKSGIITDRFAQDSSGGNIEYIAGTPAIRYLNSYAKDIPDKTVGFWLWSSASSPAEILFDNVKVMGQESFIGNVKFVDDADQEQEELFTGIVEPVFSVENYGGLSKIDAITAVYDKNGQMIDCAVINEIPLNMGNNVLRGATIEVPETVEGGRVEAYLWTSVEDGEPLGGEIGILGDADEVAESQTTSFLATESVTAKTNSFRYTDRQVVANELVLEGMHSTEESAVVTVKVQGKSSGNLILASQFETDDNGTFKKKVALNPVLCTDDETAVVTLSGIDTTAVSFEIPVFSNWEDMSVNFEAMDEASAEEYYATYVENMTFYELGCEDAVTVDIQRLTADDYAVIAFVKNHNNYDGADYGDVARASARLVGCLAEVAEFESDFQDAKALENETEKIAAIRELVESCSFMTFSTEGASNVDAICKALISSDAESLEDIYADFEEAYNIQKKAEEETVPQFTHEVEDAMSLKQFFADNRVVLGVDPDTYTDEDYAVMFIVYDEKNYDELTTYTQVNEAIVFLDCYIREYNGFIDKIKNAAQVEKNWELISDILNAEYKYIEVSLADESGVVSREYLYKRLIDSECKSLWSVETDFANAVENQLKYEIAAKDAYNTILDENAIAVFFGEYGDMMKSDKGMVMTDAQRTVFLEVYKKFNLTASEYSQMLTHVETLFQKLEVAEKLISDLNSKAEVADWTGLKAIYDGSVYAEYVGTDVSVSQVNDIRSLYLRVAAYAPFECLEDAEKAFVNSYSAQQAYEAVAGGYETFDDNELYFEEAEWNILVSGNVVKLSGKVSGNGERNIILAVYDETSPMPIYFKQIMSDKKGKFEKTIVLNPELYNADDSALLKVGGDGVNTYVFRSFELYSAEELENVVDDFLGISSKSRMKTFLEENRQLLGMNIDTSDDRIMEALFFLYDRDKKAGLFEKVEDVTDIMAGTEENSGMDALMKQTEAMISCLEDLTKAANEKVGTSKGRWSKVKTQVEIALENKWINPTVSGKIASESSLYTGMTGKKYDYMSQVETAYEKAWAESVKEASESNKGGGSGGGGGGGITSGNTSNGGSGNVQSGNGATSATVNTTVIGGENTSDVTEVETNLPGYPAAPFKDMTSDFYWARTSVNGLRNYGIVKGNGSGMFRPGDAISREEFLTMLLDVFGVERKTGSLTFEDVKVGAWYYDTVYTAYEMGIITGYNNKTFGIGDPVSRADMSVMVCRMLEKKNISLHSEEKSVVFFDYEDIPEYAYDSVQKLQRANIVNGDSYGNFNPNNNLTRAEGAVVLWPIFENVKDIIKYSWTKTY